jgi:redox-sensitive bicupin YhaK (pirin superfamily)
MHQPEARVNSGMSGSVRVPSHTYLPLTMVDIRLSSNTVIDQALPASYNGSPYLVEGELLTPGITRPHIQET